LRALHGKSVISGLRLRAKMNAASKFVARITIRAGRILSILRSSHDRVGESAAGQYFSTPAEGQFHRQTPTIFRRTEPIQLQMRSSYGSEMSRSKLLARERKRSSLGELAVLPLGWEETVAEAP